AAVGQNAIEEVNLQPAASAGGENYGSEITAAGEWFPPPFRCDQPRLLLPPHPYPHGSEWGGSISGGYVYRGSSVPGLEGQYVFADFVSGRIWTASAASGWTIELLLDTGFNIATFGEDAAGELYVADYGGGVIYRFGVGD